jgi:hypothetical protein
MLFRLFVCAAIAAGLVSAGLTTPQAQAAPAYSSASGAELANYPAGAWYVWYRYGGSRWHGIGPMSYYSAYQMVESYESRGCDAYLSQKAY